MLGKRIIAHEKIYNFATGEVVHDRKRIIGIIESIDDEKVKVYDSSNPKSCQHYSIDRTDFDTWINEGLYTIGRKVYSLPIYGGDEK